MHSGTRVSGRQWDVGPDVRNLNPFRAMHKIKCEDARPAQFPHARLSLPRAHACLVHPGRKPTRKAGSLDMTGMQCERGGT
eukprot:12081586-Heterocapsa_arctica.AAC.1